MRFTYLKETLKAAILAMTVLLATAGVSSAQSVNLTASPQTTATPDGNVIPMWGWTCGAVTQGTTAGTTCTALTYTTTAGTVAATPQAQSAAVTTGFAAGGGAWQPPLIVVPYTSSGGVSTTNLTINLENALPVQTSIMILGQVGGGLGAASTTAPGGSGPGGLAGPVREAIPRMDGAHAGQTATTWTIVVPGSFTPPSQSNRARSMVPEVCPPGVTANPCAGFGTVGGALQTGTYTWLGLKPGTYLIRSGTYPSIQGPMGLYGVLVVTQAPAGTTAGIAYPAASGAAGVANAVTYDADVVALESELDARQNRMVAAMSTVCPAAPAAQPAGCITGTAGSMVNAGFDETAKWTAQCGAGVNGLTPGGTAPTCYPPAVDYTPTYYLINGVAFSKDNRTASALPVPAAGATGNVLIRFVNAGSQMHTPSVNGLDMLLVAEDANVLPDVALAIAPAPGGNKTLSANSTPTSANCPAAATIACGLQLRTEVFQAAGKVMDVIVSPARTGTSYNNSSYHIFDRALDALSTNNSRDGGMQADLDVADTNGTTLAGLNSTGSLGAGPTYTCVPGVTLRVSDAGQGVAKSGVNIYGVTLTGNPANNTMAFGGGTLTLNSDGTFIYMQPSTATTCGGVFSYYAKSGNNTLTASATIQQTTVTGGVTAVNDAYTSKSVTLLRVGPPGVLLNDSDAAGYPLTAVNAAGATGGLTVTLTPDGSFTAIAPGAGTYSFTYRAQNSQKALSNVATVTLTFPAASNLSVTVQDAPCAAKATTPAALAGCAITDYKWIIEQDLTYPINPACQVNNGAGSTAPAGCPALGPGGVPPTPATNFHTSFMPVIAEGCTGPQSCSRGQTVYDPAPNCATTNNAPGCSATGGQHVAAACDGYGFCTIGATQLPASMPASVNLSATNPDGTPGHYYISILSGDSQNSFAYGNAKDPSDPANNCTPGVNGTPSTEPTGFTTSSACGHTMGGAPIPTPSTCTANPCTFAPVTVNLQRNPLPTATVTAFVFEDNYPLNGEPDTGGGVDGLATLEVPLGDFQIILWDTAGGIGDNTGQMHHDMFNMPLTNALNGTIDPNTGFDACPIANTGGVAVGVIIVCPTYESDGKTPSPLTGQVVVRNLMQGKYTLIVHPGAAREAAGEEWLQTNSLDGGHFLDSFIRPGEPPYFQEFGPGGYHVFFGMANPAHINARLKAICGGTVTPGIPFAGPCRNTLYGQVTNLHQDRSPSENLFGGNVFAGPTPTSATFPGQSGNYAPLSYTNCYAALGDTDGATIALAKCDPDGNFQFKNIPDGNYGIVLFDQWDDFIVDGSSHSVTIGPTGPGVNASTPGQTLYLTYPTFTWQAHLWSRSYIDVPGEGRPRLLPDGSLDPAFSPGLLQVPTRIRQVNGKPVNTLLSDIGGNSRFDETFPLFAFYTVESDTTRFRGTGVHVVNDNGGQVDGPTPVGNGNTGPYQGVLNSKESFSLPSDLSVPGALYCGSNDAACLAGSSNFVSTPGGNKSCGTSTQTTPCQSTGRIDPGNIDVEGWQGGVSEFNMIDWGKIPYAAGENGGIRGHVVNATTRPFDDPRMLFQNLWEPLVPRVQVNLYQEGFASDGVTPTLKLVDSTTTTSFDDWAQGFGQGGRAAGIPNMSCTGQDTNDPFFTYTLAGTANYLTPATTIPHNSQYKCYDGYHNLNQLQPAPYDGLFHFPSTECLNGSTFHLTPGATTGPTGTCVTITNPALAASNTDPHTGAAAKVLPAGKYVTEVVPPLGWQINKEEDLNLLIGDQYIAPAVSQFTGLGNIYITPDQASIDSANLSYTGPYTASNPYNQPWSCPTPTTCTLTPNTTNNGKQSTDYGRTTFGNFGPGGLIVQSAPCVGRLRIVPDYLSISPEVGEVAPFAGSLRPLCDRKEISLDNQMQADVDFYLYTNTPKTTSFTGFISDDFSSEFDPASPAFGEKFAVPNVPVAIRDFNGTEISRLYSDQWGVFNGVVYSTWEVDPPNPTGYAPNMMITCMNDPGPIPDPLHPGQTMNDPNWNPAYSTFCYENPFMPGDTTYLDTPVIPVSAFAEGYNPPDCAYPDGTPMILSVKGDTIPGSTGGAGPWVSGTGHHIIITALTSSVTTSTPACTSLNPPTPVGCSVGMQVPNNAYSGPAATTAPYNQKFVTRHYGFGTTKGTVTIGGADVSNNCTWSDTVINCAVTPNVGQPSIPSCPLLQTSPASTTTVTKLAAQCGELVITTGGANPKQSIDTVMVTIQATTTAGGHNVVSYVAGEDSSGHAIQKAIDNARPGDLIIVGCAPGQNSCTYNEMLLMWKPVRLQGIGDGAVTINANAHPAGKQLEPWRRQVNCLFGLALNGGVLVSTGFGTNNYDPTGQFTCAGQAEPAAAVDALVGEPILGWDATLNGNLAELLQEPTLMGAYEGAGITVLSKGLENGGTSTCTVENAAGCIPLSNSTASGGDCNPSSIFYPGNFLCNPSRIDGLTFTNSSQGGGGVYLHAFAHNMEVSNLNVTSNGGTLTGGITIGQMETVSPTLGGASGTIAQPFEYNVNVKVHNNRVTNNAAYGDELNSTTPSSAGGVTFCTGADNYKFQYNWVCGNWSSGDGGGVAHHGFTWDGDIENNWILFNQSINPSLVTNGGGLVVLGAKPDGPLGEAGTAGDVDVAPDLTDGTGPGLRIANNVFQGNTAEEGQGGGVAFMNVNGNDVLNNPTTPGTCGSGTVTDTRTGFGFAGANERWYCVNMVDNIIANNVAGWTGGGVSLIDTVLLNFHGNTVASNDSTSSAGVVFYSNGAPLGNVPPPGCNPSGFGCTGNIQDLTTSRPLPAGLVTEHYSALLFGAMATFRTSSATCPAGHDTTPATKACGTFSVPTLNSDIFWQNRSFSIASNATTHNAVALSPNLGQTGTGACPAEPAFSTSSGGYWDIGVYGDSGPTNHAALTLAPTSSIFSSGGYGGTNGSSVTFTRQYCNGSRVPPEIATLLCTTNANGNANAPGCIRPGAVGLSSWGGVPDSAIPPNNPFTITTAATVDEGNNWINMFYGPLSPTCQISAGTGSGCGGAGVNGPLGNYQSSASAGAKSFPTQTNQTIYPNP
jgi:hypothetical protein